MTYIEVKMTFYTQRRKTEMTYIEVLYIEDSLYNWVKLI